VKHQNAPRRTAVIECAIDPTAVANSQLSGARLDGRHWPREGHCKYFALLKIVDGLAKFLADVFRERTNGSPRRRMKDRRLHSPNVSYLGHGVKEERMAAGGEGAAKLETRKQKLEIGKAKSGEWRVASGEWKNKEGLIDGKVSILSGNRIRRVLTLMAERCLPWR
jgi:hypothetical protein